MRASNDGGARYRSGSAIEAQGKGTTSPSPFDELSLVLM